MFYALLVIHVLVSIILIAVVLLQSGKGADLAGAFGGGGSQTAFGPRGAGTFLGKLTTACAIIFMITSLGLAILYNKRTTSIISDRPPAAAPQPTTPAPLQRSQPQPPSQQKPSPPRQQPPK
jgi:preprotein translocase subunit SecG